MERVRPSCQGAGVGSAKFSIEKKSELEKHIVYEKVKVQIVGIETANKMTDRQIATKIRNYFIDIQ